MDHTILHLWPGDRFGRQPRLEPAAERPEGFKAAVQPRTQSADPERVNRAGRGKLLGVGRRTAPSRVDCFADSGFVAVAGRRDPIGLEHF